jgi:spore coat polysaccharide biosynthesis protein SpsF
MTSTRLPGKVLKEVLGKSLLAYQIERLRKVKLADAIVVATTVNETDDPIVKLCVDADVDYHRGPEQDVLARYLGAARKCGATTVVRVTSDCPLIDPEVVDHVISKFARAAGRADYVSNTLLRTYPRGLDTEVFSYKVLEEAFGRASEPAEREHVTPFIYHRPESFHLLNVAQDTDLSAHRWTVDTKEDFELIKLMLETLYPVNPDFRMRDCLELLDSHPEWVAINKDIEQKALS